MKIVIVVEGGIVQSILADQAGAEFVVVDWDVDGLNEEEITMLFEEECYMYTNPCADVNPEQVAHIFQVKEAYNNG